MKTETLEEVVKLENLKWSNEPCHDQTPKLIEFAKLGAKWQLENLSKEDLIQNPLVEEIVINFIGYRWNNNIGSHIYREQFKKYKQSILNDKLEIQPLIPNQDSVTATTQLQNIHTPEDHFTDKFGCVNPNLGKSEYRMGYESGFKHCLFLLEKNSL